MATSKESRKTASGRAVWQTTPTTRIIWTMCSTVFQAVGPRSKKNSVGARRKEPGPCALRERRPGGTYDELRQEWLQGGPIRDERGIREVGALLRARRSESATATTVSSREAHHDAARCFRHHCNGRFVHVEPDESFACCCSVGSIGIVEFPEQPSLAPRRHQKKRLKQEKACPENGRPDRTPAIAQSGLLCGQRMSSIAEVQESGPESGHLKEPLEWQTFPKKI